MLVQVALIIIIIIISVTEFAKYYILPRLQKKNNMCEKFSENELFKNNAILF
jgi:hypothetical protein